MAHFMRTFLQNEDGAVTVDWVVLTAAVVGLAIAIVVSMQSGALTLTGNIGDYLDTQFFND